MELNNLLSKEADPDVHTLCYSYLLLGLYPFVPHLTSELWETADIGNKLLLRLQESSSESSIEKQRWDPI
jgi:leucyl-tRNA synthetase